MEAFNRKPDKQVFILQIFPFYFTNKIISAYFPLYLQYETLLKACQLEQWCESVSYDNLALCKRHSYGSLYKLVQGDWNEIHLRHSPPN